MADESAEITLNNNTSSKVELVQPFKVENASSETVEVKPLSQTLEVKPLNQTLELKPVSQTTSETIDLRPVKVDSRQEVAVTDPIRTDANSTVDLRPVVVELCMRTGQASLPPAHVCEPYKHRIGFTLMGIEVFGLSWSGESQTIVSDRSSQPMLAWGEVSPAPVVHEDLPEHRSAAHHHGHPRPHAHGSGSGGGLRIRLTG
jgi:hypothetical protein